MERTDEPDLAALVRQEDLRAVRERLLELDLPVLLDELERLDARARAVAYRMLPRAASVRVFELLAPALQSELLTQLRSQDVGLLVAELDPDDRASLLDELPTSVARELLTGLEPDERRMTLAVLGYPPESVGRRMTPEVLSLPLGITVADALVQVREGADAAETIYMLPVVDPGRVVVGVVSLRRLLVTDPETVVDAVMSAPITVTATLDQEVAARSVRDHGALAVPVVDAEDRLLGVLTVDDAMRILELEESEDVARSGGTVPTGRPYLSTSVWRLVRSRVAWLLILIVAAALTVNVLDYFEDTLARVVTLALFVPLLIGTGGNVGAQSATTVIRALALDEVRTRDVGRVLVREVAVGVLLGGALALLAFLPSAWLAGVDIAVVLAISLVAVCTLAAGAGGVIPIVARRLGVDPAVISAPFITTFVDATGLVVYFLVAGLVLGL
ncbi:magnesium transporter [Serinicoccus chungangensis]|uniref:Magnesium transporter MgtE n=1 Tax=Serinicoccus chungangensis TaxID=767452 RepID=A0A0W8I401_9MICO|nr:magnesium transporter [Serinicoccus chungangensis]KUG52460.1 magnesium transporter [Serinicoccus chungangensis]